MQIQSDLTLVFPARSVPVQRPDPDFTPDPRQPDAQPPLVTVYEPTIWVYHTPIGRAVFEANFRIIAAAKTAIYNRGIGYAYENGPRLAALEMLRAGRQDAADLGTEDTAPSLLAEIGRLTQILAAGPTGFEPIPGSLAVARGVIDEEEWSEVQGALAFFTCGYAMARKAGRARVGEVCASILGGSMTSSSLMDFAASLTPPTAAPTSATPSSVPS